MGQTGCGWWSLFQVRTGIIPQFVCLKTALRPPPLPPRNHSMTTSMTSTGLCLACFLQLIPSFKASTHLCCMNHYLDGSDQTAAVKNLCVWVCLILFYQFIFSNIRYMYTWLLFKGQLRGASNKRQKCNGPCKQKVNTRLNKKYNNKKVKRGKYKQKIRNISNTRYQSSEINLYILVYLKVNSIQHFLTGEN